MFKESYLGEFQNKPSWPDYQTALVKTLFSISFNFCVTSIWKILLLELKFIYFVCLTFIEELNHHPFDMLKLELYILFGLLRGNNRSKSDLNCKYK